MTRIQGMGSNRSTNRPNGGGPKKQGIPSKIGRPANLMRFVSIQSNPGPPAPSAPSAPSCITYANALINNSTVGSRVMDFIGIDGANSGFDFSLVTAGWKISNAAGFSGTIQTAALDSTPSKILTMMIAVGFTGTFPASGTSVTLTNC
jgi:hypothetical protein